MIHVISGCTITPLPSAIDDCHQACLRGFEGAHSSTQGAEHVRLVALNANHQRAERKPGASMHIEVSRTRRRRGLGMDEQITCGVHCVRAHLMRIDTSAILSSYQCPVARRCRPLCVRATARAVMDSVRTSHLTTPSAAITAKLVLLKAPSYMAATSVTMTCAWSAFLKLKLSLPNRYANKILAGFDIRL